MKWEIRAQINNSFQSTYIGGVQYFVCENMSHHGLSLFENVNVHIYSTITAVLQELRILIQSYT